MIRAKFTVTSITRYYNMTGATVHFMPIYDRTIAEDQRFSEATPSGELQMFLTNAAVLEQCTLGQHFYVDFLPVPAPSPL